jgi:hypothetical protein
MEVHKAIWLEFVPASLYASVQIACVKNGTNAIAKTAIVVLMLTREAKMFIWE